MKKTLSLILSFCLIFSNFVFASLEKDVTYILSDFSKGLNSHISPLLTPPNQAVETKNIRFNGRYGAFTKRETLITAWDAGSNSVQGLHRYYKTDGTQKAIIATGTILAIGDAGATTTTTINAGLSDGKRWQFVTYKDIAIGANGTNRMVKYDGKTQTTADTDGSRTASELCAELGAPFAELNTGSNLDASKWYQYRMMFLVSGVTYYSNARSNPIQTGSSVRDITLTNIPIGPSGTTARYLYRTLDNSNQANVEADNTMYLVATISDNTTTTYNDAMADATAATQTAWSTSGKSDCTPPTLKYIEIHKERLFGAGDSTYPSYLFFSDDGNPDFYLPTAFEAIRIDDGDEITFIKPQLGILTIGKTNTIQKYYTEGSITTDWYTSDVFSTVGCPAPYSVANTPAGIFYLGRHGIYRFDGQNSHLISDAATPEINDISQADIEDVAGFYHNNEYRLAYTSTSSGGASNNRVLVYNLVRDAYTIDTENVASWATFSSGTDFGVLYSGSSASNGYVVAHSSTLDSLSKRYKSEIDAGTFDDTRSYGDEDAPYVELAWDSTIDGWLTELQTKDASINTINDIGAYLPNSIIDRPDTAGTWTSEVYQIDAQTLDKLYWQESLGSYGDVTWQIRLGATSAACTAAAWNTAVTNPNGSDVSGITANAFIQLRANLSTTDVNYTPLLYSDEGYVFKLLYSKVGAQNETSVLSVYKTGWLDFGKPTNKKLIKKIKVYYSGTSGKLNFDIKGDDGDIDQDFDIDLSVLPTISLADEYRGEGDLKVYTYYPPMNSATVPSLVSKLFQITITENGVTGWEFNRAEFKFDTEEDYD